MLRQALRKSADVYKRWPLLLLMLYLAHLMSFETLISENKDIKTHPLKGFIATKANGQPVPATDYWLLFFKHSVVKESAPGAHHTQLTMDAGEAPVIQTPLAQLHATKLAQRALIPPATDRQCVLQVFRI